MAVLVCHHSAWQQALKDRGNLSGTSQGGAVGIYIAAVAICQTPQTSLTRTRTSGEVRDVFVIAQECLHRGKVFCFS